MEKEKVKNPVVVVPGYPYISPDLEIDPAAFGETQPVVAVVPLAEKEIPKDGKDTEVLIVALHIQILGRAKVDAGKLEYLKVKTPEKKKGVLI